MVELPLVVASALDDLLGNAAGVKKTRRELTRDLHWTITHVSLGRLGTVYLANVALLGCLATARRWDRRRALHLGEAYNRAGLADLVKSSPYQEATQLIVGALREAATRTAPQADATAARVGLAASFADATAGLVRGNPIVRTVADRMAGITAQVDNDLWAMKRYPGYVERVEDDEALVVVKTYEQDELRSLPLSLLTAVGLQTRGDSFVLYEFQWSADAVASVCAPAVSLEIEPTSTEWEQLEAELRAGEESFPRPAVVGKAASVAPAGGGRRKPAGAGGAGG